MKVLTNSAVRRYRRVLVLAGVIFLVTAVFGAPLAGILKGRSSDFQDPHDQTLQAQAAIERATGQTADYGVAALVATTRNVRINERAQRRPQRVLELLSKQPGFQRGLSYPTTHERTLASKDGHKSLVLAAFTTQDQSAAAVAALRRSSKLDGVGVTFGGQDIAFSEINTRTRSDLKAAEALAFPILLLLSLWVFRGLIAALLPLLVGGFAIVFTFSLLRLFNQYHGLSIFAVNLVTGMGLGLAIDYSLFVLTRYREELAGGADTRAAIAKTLQTAGRTVLYSSLTVAGALASMLVFPERFLYSMGVGGAIVALSAGAVSLLVLPAVLVALGPRINSLAPAWMQEGTARAARTDENGAWFSLARSVMRRPGVIALLTSAALLAAALPSLRVELVRADSHVLPSTSETRQLAQVLGTQFTADGSQTIPIVVHASAKNRHAVNALKDKIFKTAGSQATGSSPRYIGKQTWEIDLLPRGVGASKANQNLIRRLHTRLASSGALVGGPTAGFVDQKASIADRLPLALAILGIVTASFLFLMTGSLLLPLKALLMNLLTVSVGAGLLVLIFQDGHLSSKLGFSPIGGLEESNLVLLFIVAFALSTDYGVFLLARIKEYHDTGMPTRQAVAYGLERTGRLVTAAALLFCVAIGAFATSHIFFVKQLGVGAALAVAIDATVVRALLVPALMALLAERNWWAPRPLRWLHDRIGLREDEPHKPRESREPRHRERPSIDDIEIGPLTFTEVRQAHERRVRRVPRS
ncbi:MAG TPA: MMPL family transporter [Solirubrobacteraceae bacterium]|nr:MMPL family transporter [Solirubrobacteraceae bacterium]